MKRYEIFQRISKLMYYRQYIVNIIYIQMYMHEVGMAKVFDTIFSQSLFFNTEASPVVFATHGQTTFPDE